MYVILILCLDMYILYVIFILMKIKCCNVIVLKDVLFLKVFCDIELYYESYVFSNVYKYVYVIKVFENIWEK